MRTLAPATARHARLLRLVNRMDADEVGRRSDAERMMWVNSHVARDNDVARSKEEESLRERQLPLGIGENSITSHGQATHANLYQFRELPMYPGEFIPAEHKTLSSLRDELKMDLTAQSLKDAWMRVSGGNFFQSIEDYYAKVDGIDSEQLGEIVAAVIPGLSRHESKALVTKVLESISKPSDSAARQLGRTITAEAVGLDNAPGHYTNFLEWMGGLTETRAFKTEHALFQFSRRKFNRGDVQVMFENYNLMSKATMQQESADSYSHFYSVLKDFATKVSSDDTRHQIGVRIDEAEVDSETGVAVGQGVADGRKYDFVAVIRENNNRNGSVYIMGKPLHQAFDNRSWVMEMVLQPFDEAKLDYRDFDVSIISEGKAQPFVGNDIGASAVRMAVANAIAKMIPCARIPLKKSGLLSVDRRTELGQFPGFVDGKKQRRKFAKR